MKPHDIFHTHTRCTHSYTICETESVSRSVLSDSATTWTVILQASLSMGFSRQEYWSGLPCPSPGDLPDTGIEPESPALQADFLPSDPLCVCVHAKLLQWCPTLCGSIDYSFPGSSVRGILQARILQWVAMPFTKGSSWPMDQTHISYVSCIVKRVLDH